MQSALPRDLNLAFGGLRSGQFHLEQNRNLLFTLQRSLHSEINDANRQEEHRRTDPDGEWLIWLEMETLTRLDYCITRG